MICGSLSASGVGVIPKFDGVIKRNVSDFDPPLIPSGIVSYLLYFHICLHIFQ